MQKSYKKNTINDELEINSNKCRNILSEAKRCLNCATKPCSLKCPLDIDIPSFISAIKEQKFFDAYNRICEKSPFPAICSKICPQNKQCESGCVRKNKGSSVQISKLESFVASIYDNLGVKENNKPAKLISAKIKKVAVIGSGPAGLSCAYYLKKYGHAVSIFEKLAEAGGMLNYGVPESRLRKDILKNEIKKIQKMGISIYTNVNVGSDVYLYDLIKIKGFDAIFLSLGTWKARRLDIDGEDSRNVVNFVDFLISYHKGKSVLDKKSINNIAVVGGGSVAIDMARLALTLKNVKNVYLIYRRSINEMLASENEITVAKSEGVKFQMLTNVKKIVTNSVGTISKILCSKNELTNKLDSSKRFSFKEIIKSDFEINVDAVITCVGSAASEFPVQDPYFKMIYDKNGKIQTNEKSQCTNVPEIFFGGDMILGPSTAAAAMAHGKKVAENINNYLNTT